MGADLCISKSIHVILLFGLLSHNSDGHILRLPCLTYANFSISKANYVLTQYVLERYNDLNVDECKNRCIEHKACKSINTRRASGENCQLNSKSDEDPFDSVVLSENIGWTYQTTNYKARNIGHTCEEKSPCPCGMTCIDACTCPGYECQKTRIGTFRDCQDAYNKNFTASTIFSLCSPGMNVINVRCDMRTDGGGWIVLQRRIDASVDFYRGWSDYKNGFGDLNGNFWLGLEKIHKLTSPGRGAILRVDLRHNAAPNELKFAEYSNFEILSESEGYKLTFSSYSTSSNAGDSLLYHKDQKFSTFDRDQDSSVAENCSVVNKGAWWYNKCHYSNLNGLYPGQNQHVYEGMTWEGLQRTYGGVIFSEMKIKYSLS